MGGEGKNLYVINMLEKKGMSEVRICENVPFVLFYIPLKQLIVNKKLLSATAATFTRLYHCKADV